MPMIDVNRRRNLGFFFDQSVARLPDKVAIIDLFGGRERASTYRQLAARMDAAASMLPRLGVRAAERLPMLTGTRPEFTGFFFGAMPMGAIPLPLNTRPAADTLAHIIGGAGCVAAVVDPTGHRDALAIAERLPLRLLLDREHEGFRSFEREMAVPAAPVVPPPIAD